MEKIKTRQIMRFAQDNNIYVIALLLLIVPSLIYPDYGSAASMTVLVKNVTMWGTMAIAMTFVLVLGERDLAMGMYVSMSTVILAMSSNMVNTPVGIILTLAVGVLAGVVNGLIITKLRINSFIATLGTQNFFKGFGLWLCDSTPVYVTDFNLMDFFSAPINLFGWKMIIGGFTVTWPMVVLVVLIVLCTLFFKYTRTGQAMFIIGGNREAGVYAGINSNKIIIFGFAMAGLIGSIAAIMVTSMQATGNAAIGERYALQSIAACVLGGVRMAGGYGRVTNAVCGALVIQLITKVLYQMDASMASLQNGIIGAILILVLIMDRFSTKKED